MPLKISSLNIQYISICQTLVTAEPWGSVWALAWTLQSHRNWNLATVLGWLPEWPAWSKPGQLILGLGREGEQGSGERAQWANLPAPSWCQVGLLSITCKVQVSMFSLVFCAPVFWQFSRQYLPTIVAVIQTAEWWNQLTHYYTQVTSNLNPFPLNPLLFSSKVLSGFGVLIWILTDLASAPAEYCGR